MQWISRARETCEPVLQMGPDGPHFMSTLYRTLQLNVDALDGVETGPSKASVQDELTLMIFQRREHRSKVRYELFFWN